MKEEKTPAKKPLENQQTTGKDFQHPSGTTEKEVIAELTETLQRTQAEFENYKKRVEKENVEFVKYAKAEIIQKILPTIDTFEIALKSTNDKEKFVKGIEMVYAQLRSLLKAEGLKPIDALDKKFDPYLHEVMLKEKSDKDDEIILEELQKGYMLNDKVLRHSKVKISEKTKTK
jgi:molecular chaperone GrpE